MRGAVAIGRVDEPAAVGRPGELGFVRLRWSSRRDASPPSLADAEKTSPWTVNAIFLPSGESASSSKLIGEREMIDGRRRRRAAQRDRAISRAWPVAVSTVQMPKIALERDRPAVGRDRRPEHAAVAEGRQRATGLPALPGPPARSAAQMFWAPLRSDMKYSVRAVARPHRPRVLRAASGHRLVDGNGVDSGRTPPVLTSQISLSSR